MLFYSWNYKWQRFVFSGPADSQVPPVTLKSQGIVVPSGKQAHAAQADVDSQDEDESDEEVTNVAKQGGAAAGGARPFLRDPALLRAQRVASAYSEAAGDAPWMQPGYDPRAQQQPDSSQQQQGQPVGELSERDKAYRARNKARLGNHNRKRGADRKARGGGIF